MPYAILRIKKLKSAGAIKMVGEHNNREKETLNADPAQENVFLVNPAERVARVTPTAAVEGAGLVPTASATGDATEDGKDAGVTWAAVNARIAEAEARVRRNGVLACEVFLGASPEYFRPRGGPGGTWDPQRLESWKESSMAWLTREWGERNVVSAVLHLDETTPHIQAVVVPIDPDTGRMNATRWLDGRQALSAMQDRYATAVEGLGLERGVRGSVANHISIKSWYGHLQQQVPQVPDPEVEVPGQLFLEKARKGFAANETARIRQEQEPSLAVIESQARERQLAVRQRRDAEATSRRLEKELKKEREDRAKREAELKQENAALRKERDTLKEQREGFRQVPLAQAAAWFDPEELAEADVRVGKDDEGRPRLYDATGKVVGRNIIDLAMRVHGCERAEEAIAWLQVRQGSMAAIQGVVSASEVWERVEKALPICREVQSKPALMRRARYERAERQAAWRKPKDFTGLQKIFARLSFSLTRQWQQMGFIYSLFDSLFKSPVTDYDPHRPLPDGRQSPLSGIVREWDRQEAARLRAEAMNYTPYQGPRR
jgi:hypothetical protein